MTIHLYLQGRLIHYVQRQKRSGSFQQVRFPFQIGRQYGFAAVSLTQGQRKLRPNLSAGAYYQYLVLSHYISCCQKFPPLLRSWRKVPVAKKSIRGRNLINRLFFLMTEIQK